MNRQSDRWKLAACIAMLKQVGKSDIISCIKQYSKQISSIVPVYEVITVRSVSHSLKKGQDASKKMGTFDV